MYEFSTVENNALMTRMEILHYIVLKLRV